MFKVGDEVVCVDAEPRAPLGTMLPNGCLSSGSTGLELGRIYKVFRVGATMRGYLGVDVGYGPKTGANAGFSQASRFRKVQRRNLSEWLRTAATDEETKHIDKSVKERA